MSRIFENLPECRHPSITSQTPTNLVDKEGTEFAKNFHVPEELPTVDLDIETEDFSREVATLFAALCCTKNPFDSDEEEEDVPVRHRTEEEKADARRIRQQQVEGYYQRILEEDIAAAAAVEAVVNRQIIRAKSPRRKRQESPRPLAVRIPWIRRIPRRT
jgi:hypothetical protein